MPLKGKVIVITGSTRGIGRAIAEACARRGAHVVISSRHEEAVRITCKQLEAAGLAASGLAADVTNTGELRALLDFVAREQGRVDVWINNAGISSGYRRLHELSEEEMERIVDVNLTSTLRACRLVIPYFIDQGGGVLINMSGRGGRGDASPFMTVYGATKAGVTSLSKSLAEEYADYPISIHSASPGMVETDMFEDVETNPELAETLAGLPYIFKAIGTSLDEVGEFFADIADQEPGKETGKSYNLLRGWRLFRGIGLMMYYRATGKLKE